jgi:hypothetical protein
VTLGELFYGFGDSKVQIHRLRTQGKEEKMSSVGGSFLKFVHEKEDQSSREKEAEMNVF